MSHSCCDTKDIEAQNYRSRALWLVLLLNLAMFFVEMMASLLANSQAVMADSFDMLGDSLVYGVSLYVVGKSMHYKVLAAKFKAWIMIISAVFLFSFAIYRVFYLQIPDQQIMGLIGFLALLVNILCLFILTGFRNSDINMKSAWICSRNDIIVNFSVIIAALLVHLTKSPWPDLIIGIGLSALFLKSASYIFYEANVIKLQNENDGSDTYV